MADYKAVRMMHIGGWATGIVMAALMFWGFFVTSHHKPVVEPAITPTATSITF